MPERPSPIAFTVPGKPGRWQRRVRTAAGHTYMPKEVTDYKNAVRFFFGQAKPHGWQAWPGPVGLTIRAEYTIPKSWPKWRAGQVQLHPWATVRSDWDNVGKVVSDALKGLAYDDDRQVVNAVVQKVRVTGRTGLSVELRFFAVPPRTRAEAALDGSVDSAREGGLPEQNRP